MGIKKFKDYIKEDKEELVGKRIRLIQMGDDPNPVEPGTEGTIDHVDSIGQLHVKWDNGRSLAIVPEEDQYEIITEELDGAAGGASTTSTVGSGTAVGSGDMGSFTSAMGVSVSGGDSGTAFATNSNVAGMGPIVSPQPSSIPGDVRGGKKGSGDLGSVGGVFTKQPAGGTKKKKKKKTKRAQIASNIDKFYVTNYKETTKDGKIIQSWKTFKDS